MKEKFGTYLVRKGLISGVQLETALTHQSMQGGRIGTVLAHLRYVTDKQLLRALSDYFNCQHVDLSTYNVDLDLIRKVKPAMARRIKALPVQEDLDGNGRRILFVAMRQPDDLVSQDQLVFATNSAIIPMVALDNALNDALDYFYQDGENMAIPTYDGRDKILDYQQTSPDSLDHLYENMNVVPEEQRYQRSNKKASLEDLHVELAQEVDAKTYLKFLIKILLKKGLIEPEDIPDLIKR